MDPALADMTVALFGDALAGAEDPEALLREWSGRYPDLQGDFAGVALDRVDESLADYSQPAASQARLARGILASIAAVDSRPGGPFPTSIHRGPDGNSLPDASRAAGIGYPNELALRLRLPAAVVDQIGLRRLDVQSIPRVLVQQIAYELAAASDDVLRWLSPLSTASPGFVREPTPVYGAAHRFQDTFARDDWDPSDRAYWEGVLPLTRPALDL